MKRTAQCSPPLTAKKKQSRAKRKLIVRRVRVQYPPLPQIPKLLTSPSQSPSSSAFSAFHHPLTVPSPSITAAPCAFHLSLPPPVVRFTTPFSSFSLAISAHIVLLNKLEYDGKEPMPYADESAPLGSGKREKWLAIKDESGADESGEGGV